MNVVEANPDLFNNTLSGCKIRQSEERGVKEQEVEITGTRIVQVTFFSIGTTLPSLATAYASFANTRRLGQPLARLSFTPSPFYKVEKRLTIGENDIRAYIIFRYYIIS